MRSSESALSSSPSSPPEATADTWGSAPLPTSPAVHSFTKKKKHSSRASHRGGERRRHGGEGRREAVILETSFNNNTGMITYAHTRT